MYYSPDVKEAVKSPLDRQTTSKLFSALQTVTATVSLAYCSVMTHTFMCSPSDWLFSLVHKRQLAVLPAWSLAGLWLSPKVCNIHLVAVHHYLQCAGTVPDLWGWVKLTGMFFLQTKDQVRTGRKSKCHWLISKGFILLFSPFYRAQMHFIFLLYYLNR